MRSFNLFLRTCTVPHLTIRKTITRKGCFASNTLDVLLCSKDGINVFEVILEILKEVLINLLCGTSLARATMFILLNIFVDTTVWFCKYYIVLLLGHFLKSDHEAGVAWSNTHIRHFLLEIPKLWTVLLWRSMLVVNHNTAFSIHDISHCDVWDLWHTSTRMGRLRVFERRKFIITISDERRLLFKWGF